MTGPDDELLGGLPKSRPGTRSSRRSGGPPPARRTPPPEPPDPVGDAVRTVARSAEAGLKVAQAVTREVFRRLPRV